MTETELLTLRDQLLAMRARWAERRLVYERRIHTTDGSTVTATACRDLCAEVLNDLDQALAAAADDSAAAGQPTH
ncbi:hypothetical protein [Sphaerimonospora mesophila]|uniref:hypothetical protein n=1 Tax=Sphaerimonospora mesophila TaxID=37483 RepID=UPI0006E3563A